LINLANLMQFLLDWSLGLVVFGADCHFILSVKIIQLNYEVFAL